MKRRLRRSLYFFHKHHHHHQECQINFRENVHAIRLWFLMDQSVLVHIGTHRDYDGLEGSNNDLFFAGGAGMRKVFSNELIIIIIITLIIVPKQQVECEQIGIFESPLNDL